MVEQFDLVTAVFRPKVVDTLRSGCVPFIGTKARWEALWVVTEEDGGPYVGQWVFGMLEEDRQKVGWTGHWVPWEDLVIECHIPQEDRMIGGEDETITRETTETTP